MLELGAGYGRWLVIAATAVQLYSDLPYYLVGVEAEPTHFRFMKRHFDDNGISRRRIGRRRARLVNAAVTERDGHVDFYVGGSSEWYGQMIAPTTGASAGIARVRSVSLNTLIAPLAHVDLIDLDVQGAEADVLASAREALDAKVQRVHVGTHGPEPEEGVRSLFGALGWTNLNDYACGSEAETPWGPMHFLDGVQTWVNPRFERDAVVHGQDSPRAR